MRWIVPLLFLLTIPLANLMIGTVGTCVPGGPCLIPVWPGVMAPSGVLMIGIALVLRDAVHEEWGASGAAILIIFGSALSFFVAPPALAIASGVAFLVSELADLLIYAPMRRRNLVAAVTASSVVGAMVDSAVFLWLAFGSLQYLAGQFIGKGWAVLLAALVLIEIRRRRACA